MSSDTLCTEYELAVDIAETPVCQWAPRCNKPALPDDIFCRQCREEEDRHFPDDGSAIKIELDDNGELNGAEYQTTVANWHAARDAWDKEVSK